MKKVLSLILALVMTLSVISFGAGAEEFSDNSDITYEEAVNVMYAIGIISGYENGTFNPAGSLTRGAAAKIVCNMVLGPTVAGALVADTAPFDDVPKNHTFAPYISYVSEKGIVNGYGDGTFHPAGTLTGFAFMKMLLGALGYDSEMEGYVGENWSVEVAKRGLSLHLDEGLVGDFEGGHHIDRQTAMLLAFNAMQKRLVTYDNKASLTVGNITVDKLSEAKPSAESFMSAYFPKLENKADVDPMGRPATRWTNDRTEIGLFVKQPTLTYTGEVAGYKIYKDLGVGAEKIPVVRYVLDGVDKTSTIGSNISGDGQAYHCRFTELSRKQERMTGDACVTTEIYYNDQTGTVDVIQIRPLIGEITKVYEEDGKRYVYVSSLLRKYRPHDGFFQTEDYDYGDKVLYTIDASSGEVQTMTTPKTYTGTVTKVAGSSTYYIDNVKYTRSLDLEDEGLVDNTAEYPNRPISLHNRVTLYLAATGEVLYAELAGKDPAQQAIILEMATDTDTYGKQTYWAKVLRVDGTVEEIRISEYNADLVNDLVECRKSGSTYTLKRVATALKGLVHIENGKPQLTVRGVPSYYYGNDKTVFLVVSEDADGKPVYKRYLGIKSVPDIHENNESVLSFAYCQNGGSLASIVFINGAVVKNYTTNDYVYIQGSSITGKVTDKYGDVYPYPAIIDGKVTTVYMDAPMNGNQLYTQLAYDDNQTAELAPSANYLFPTTVNDDEYTAKMTVTGEFEDDVIELDNTGYAVENVQVWTVTVNSALNKEDTIAAGTIKGIEQGAAVRAIFADEMLSVLIHYVDGATKQALPNVGADDSTQPPIVGEPPYDVDSDEDTMELVRIERIENDWGKLNVVSKAPVAIMVGQARELKVQVYNGNTLVAEGAQATKPRYSKGAEMKVAADIKPTVATDSRALSGEFIVKVSLTYKNKTYTCSEKLTLAADPNYSGGGQSGQIQFKPAAYPVPALAVDGKMTLSGVVLRSDLQYNGGYGLQFTCSNPTGDYIANGSGWINCTIWDMSTGEVVGKTPNQFVQRWGSKDIGPRGNVVTVAYLDETLALDQIPGKLFKVQINFVIDETTGGMQYSGTTDPTLEEMRAHVAGRYDILPNAYTMTAVFEVG